jgi:hypothetical protein
MEVQIARESSISRLMERAIEAGFVPAERVEFLPLTE